MKTLQFTRAISVVFVLLMIGGCVNDDDFEVPNLTIIEPELGGEVITISALRNLFLQEEATVDLSEFTQYVEGYVISSDTVSYTHLTLPTTPYV